ncbi:MAG: hypothetical protein IAE91_11235 [Ignavibacteriaceae bacterium]|nr:hypothetical protein [Ignavibacteriaceae bacterium]
MEQELEKYLIYIFNPRNPVLIGLLFGGLFVFLFVNFYIKIFIPQKIKFETEKLKLSALFSDYAPGIILRLDSSLKLVFANKAFFDSNYSKDDIERFIVNIFTTSLKIPKRFIENSEHFEITERFSERIFSLQIIGIKEFSFIQVYFHDLTDRVEAEIKMREFQTKLLENTLNLQKNIELEKMRIAKELHDGLVQDLVALKMGIESITEKNPSPALNETLTRSVNIIEDVRLISRGLTPFTLKELGIPQALKFITNYLKNSSNLKISLDLIGNEERFNSNIEIFIFRSTQEIVTNVIKHAEAKNLNIMFINSEDKLSLIVSDDGKGFDFEHYINSINENSGFGLLNMREFTNYLGGKFSINSILGEGTNILIEFSKTSELLPVKNENF